MEIMNLCWDVGSFSKLSRRCASKESYVVQTQNNVSAPKLQNKALRIVLHENPRDLSEASLGGVLWPTTPRGAHLSWQVAPGVAPGAMSSDADDLVARLLERVTVLEGRLQSDTILGHNLDLAENSLTVRRAVARSTNL